MTSMTNPTRRPSVIEGFELMTDWSGARIKRRRHTIANRDYVGEAWNAVGESLREAMLVQKQRITSRSSN